MTSAITAYDYPGHFVDEQQHGPFRRWRHEHRFTAMADGTTQMTDIVEFQSPLGAAGSVADRLGLCRYMTRLLCQRNTWLKNALEARRWTPALQRAVSRLTNKAHAEPEHLRAAATLSRPRDYREYSASFRALCLSVKSPARSPSVAIADQARSHGSGS